MENAWNARVTSHVALKDVSSLITVQSVCETIGFVKQVLRAYKGEAPKLAVSGLNPHCGENGLFGTEEGDAIAPAIEKARAEGIDVLGPFPSDTIWLKVLAREYDGVVSMYHDQGQIALKILGFDRGVTVHGGDASAHCHPCPRHSALTLLARVWQIPGFEAGIYHYQPDGGKSKEQFLRM